jgi:molybdopterin biosynthesis enzyme MoaB
MREGCVGCGRWRRCKDWRTEFRAEQVYEVSQEIKSTLVVTTGGSGVSVPDSPDNGFCSVYCALRAKEMQGRSSILRPYQCGALIYQAVTSRT